MRLLTAALAVCSATACHSLKPQTDVPRAREASGAQTFVYECEDSFRFTARTEGDRVWLFLADGAVQLPRARSAEGEKYQGAQVTFWHRGEEAMITLGERYYVGCRNNRSRAIWEHAKLNGVDFRATGNEPGWQLEIHAGGDLVFVTDYGHASHRFATPSPAVNEAAGTTTYSANNPEHGISVRLDRIPCRDSMSGEAFAISVTVQLDGRSYQGCGRQLH